MADLLSKGLSRAKQVYLTNKIPVLVATRLSYTQCIRLACLCIQQFPLVVILITDWHAMSCGLLFCMYVCMSLLASHLGNLLEYESNNGNIVMLIFSLLLVGFSYWMLGWWPLYIHSLWWFPSTSTKDTYCQVPRRWWLFSWCVCYDLL